MRQAGYMAAAGIYALDHHVERLKVDNSRASSIAHLLNDLPFVSGMKPVQTNILIFNLIDTLDAKSFVEKLKEKGILSAAFGPKSIRFTFHLDITDDDMENLSKILKSIKTI